MLWFWGFFLTIADTGLSTKAGVILPSGKSCISPFVCLPPATHHKQGAGKPILGPHISVLPPCLLWVASTDRAKELTKTICLEEDTSTEL